MSTPAHDPRRRRLLGAGGGLLLVAALPWPAAGGEAIEIGMAGTSTGSAVWFRPRGLRIRPGQAVRWVNHDAGNVHTATAYHPANGKPLRLPQDAKPWDSGYLLPGQSFTWVFDVPGVYDYFCLPHEHAGMVGRIVVEGAPAGRPYTGTDAQLPPVAVAGFPEVEAVLSQGRVD
ncbi:plastocyanin/azurin family copper-binding protein [Castellaniella ginsengisoli]|uniref:Plastocyanin/azurin family copper-binding protein n=1 Tax=Castellaniella ginsengisoli TaxID=546114 RepID=A0AB39D8T9_9BURK